MTRWQRPEVSSWSSLGRLTNLHDELDRLFESPWFDVSRSAQGLAGWLPVMDLYEDSEGFVLKAELPGMKREDIELALHEGALTVSGERKREEKRQEGGVFREERNYGKFQRSIVLPKPVAADKVTATYKDGVLTVTLPKTEEVKPKQIEVVVK